MISLTISPDSGAPLGGTALLGLAHGILGAGETHVKVQSRYSLLWLAPTAGEGALIHVGEANWQSDPHPFGPYRVETTADGEVVRIGPEIVNKLEEFSPLTLEIDGRRFEVFWPDNVVPRTGAALLGAVSGIKRSSVGDPTEGRLVGQRVVENEVPKATEDQDEQDLAEPDVPSMMEPEHPGDKDVEEGGSAGAGKSRIYVILGGLLFALIAALVLAYFIFQRNANSGDVVHSDDDVPALQPPSCTREALAAVPGGFSEMSQAMVACGDRLSADTAFLLVENAANSGDAEALLALATLYDEASFDPVFEGQFGIALEGNLALATEYYFRAMQQESEPARTRLMDACTRLESRSDTLSVGAHDDYCH